MTDAPQEISRERHRERVSQVRRKLAVDGPPRLREAPGDFETVTLPERDCDVLRDLLIAEGAETVIEVGLAYGSSALAIGEALLCCGMPLHVIIDPFQATVWSDVGWELMCDADLDKNARLILEPSSVALPRLVGEGLTADGAFVDGSHRFHEVFIDLYFLRKIVRPGGIIILDDYWWPSVRTALRYFEVNMGWHVIPDAFDSGTTDEATGSRRAAALRLPDPPFEPDFQLFQPF